MRVLVIGAQGALGRRCAEALSDAGHDVIRAGRRVESAPDFRLVDLDDVATVAGACSDVDLVVSAVRHPNHNAERVVLKNGGLLVNLASHTVSDRVELKEEAGDARGLVVLHAGLAPGVYTLALKEMLAEHPDADTVVMAAAWSLVQTSGPAAMIDFGYPAMQGNSRRPTRIIDFPKPIGRRRCLYVGGEEIGFFGELADGRDARIYACWTERPWNAQVLFFNATGILSRLPLQAFTLGRRITQKHTSHESKRDMVIAAKGNRVLAAGYVAGEGDYLMTAAATVAFAEALLARRERAPDLHGVVGAEEIFDLDDLRPGLEQRGIRVDRVPA
jgi:NAD(P)-dependent dehydrogenase (short-subunit alcohol dehydrogenase family)